MSFKDFSSGQKPPKSSKPTTADAAAAPAGVETPAKPANDTGDGAKPAKK